MENARFFIIDKDGETLIVSPVRELGSFSEDEVRNEWDKLLDYLDHSQTTRVVLDLSKLTYFGSTMLEMMVVLWKRLSGKQGKLAICSVSTVGREILHIAKFDTIWPICDTRQEALAKVTGS
jgi:anti-anti-sigma factor